MSRVFSTLLLFLLTFSSSAENLFKWNETKAGSHVLANSNHQQVFKSGKNFNINTTLLKKYKVNDTFTINLSSSDKFTAKVSKTKTKGNDIHHIIAEIEKDNETLPVVITLGKNQFFIRIVTKENVFVAQGLNSQGTLIDEQWLTQSGFCHKNDAKIPQDSPKFKNRQLQNKFHKNTKLNKQKSTLSKVSPDVVNQPNLITSLNVQNTEEVATIKVLFVYSLTSQALYEGDISIRLAHIVEVTNQIYNDSEVHMQIEIADTLPVDYSDDALSDEALDAITFQEHEVFNDIENIRYEAGADMVVLLRPFIDGDDACGLAWANSSINNSINYMYSHTSIDCGDYVNAHELGHNMGLAHSRAQGSIGYSFPYAIGHRVEDVKNGFATVMAYEVSNASKVYKFSNPDVLCTELPCGIDRDDPVNGADSSFALNQVRFQVEAIMDDVPDLTLAMNALSNVTNSNLKSCIESQINNNNITYANQVRNLYCSYQNINTLAGLDSFTGITNAYLAGNNFSNISILETLTKLSTLSLEASNLTELTPLSNLKSLTRLYLRNNKIVDLTPLSTLTNLTNLELDYNNVATLDGLEGLDVLTYLQISNNNITSISAINNLQNLVSLQLENNQISDISPIVNLINLNWLSLSQNQINTLPSLSKLTKLEYFSAASNNISTLSNFTGNPSIIILDLQDNQIGQLIDFSEFTALKDISLQNNQLTNISAISSAVNLMTLNIQNNQITNAQPLSYLSNLKQILIANNPLTDLDWLSNLENLEQLAIDNTNTTDLSPLNGLINLTSLSISGNPITNIDSISNLYNLKSLYSPNTNIVDISAIFKLYNEWGQINFIGNNNIYCWQINYIKSFIIYDFFDEPTSCDTSKDTLDFDNDGLNNADELLNNSNPLFNNETAGLVEFQIDSLILNEADKTIELKVLRSTGDMGEISIDVRTNNITAIAGDDFNDINTTLTFSDGELFKILTVDILDDSHYDSNETFELELLNPVSTTIGANSKLTVTLIDQDEIILNWLTAYQEINENSSTITLSLNRPADAKGEMSVDINYLDYTAINGTDYEFENQTVVFPEGVFTKEIQIDIIDNDEFQGDRGFYLELSNPVNAIVDVKSNTTFIQIIDDEQPAKGVLSFERSAFSFNENDGEIEVKVVRVNGNHGELTVNFNVSDISATAGNDYNLSSGQFIFSEVDYEKTITLSIIDDSIDENNESLSITLSAEDNSIIGVIDETTITIIDNDDAVVIPPNTSNNNSSGGGGSIFYMLFILLGAVLLSKNKQLTFRN